MIPEAVHDEIRTAVNLITSTSTKRLDGNGWKVYKVGDIVRTDINPNECEES